FISQGHPFVGVKYGDPINDAGEKGANNALVFLVKLADELKMNSAVSLYARGARYSLSEEEIINMEGAARDFLASEYHYPPKSSCEAPRERSRGVYFVWGRMISRAESGRLGTSTERKDKS